MSADPRAEKTLDEAIALFGAESGTVHLSNPDRTALELSAVRGPMPEPVLAAIRLIPWGKGMAGLAAERLEAVQTCNIQTTTSSDVRPGARATGLSGAIVVPILSGEDVVGTIGVGVRAERTFTTDEAERLLDHGRAFARSIARPAAQVLRDAVARQADAAGLAWLDDLVDRARQGDGETVATQFPAAARRLGRGSLDLRSALTGPFGDVPLRAWRVEDAGRALVLMAFQAADGPEREGLAIRIYFAGELRERASVMRSMALLGEGTGDPFWVLDAVRMSAVELFEAAMADNPFTSRVLPELEFRKAVLKCAFVGVSLDRVAGLWARADDELTRMLLSYVTEREVAGRSVPPDLWIPMARAPIPGLGAKLIGYLEHPSETHRAAAARALRHLGDAGWAGGQSRAREFLQDRMARETDESVKKALGWALG
jgi:L-methionine (R)-S-oxide reductase